MSFKNIKSNISPKARIILLSVGIIAAGSIWAMYSAFSSDDNEIPSGVGGGVSINNDNNTEKERGDKQTLLPKDSVQQKQIEELKDKEKEERIKSGSFMEQLELNNDVKVLKEIEQDLGGKPVETGVDDVTDKLRERQMKAQELIEKQRRAKVNAVENSQQTGGVNGGQAYRPGVQNGGVTAYIPEPFDEKAFMEKETNRIEAKKNAINIYSKKITVSTIGTVGNGSLNNSQSSEKTQTAKNTTGKTDYNSFIRDPSEYPKADVASLDKFRNMARGELGSDAPAELRGQQDNYESVVYPTGAPQFDVSEKITAGEMFYAVLEIEVNTDEISPVRATIVQEGPLKNAVLVGMPERTGAKGMIKFDTMSLNGQTYSGLNVVAVDPNTMRSAFADDVDYHTFERYFKLAAASIVAGYAEALVSVEKETSATGTESEKRTAIPKASDRLAVAVGRVGEKLEPKFAEEFDRPPTVTIFRNRDLGIMFLSELIINGENK